MHYGQDSRDAASLPSRNGFRSTTGLPLSRRRVYRGITDAPTTQRPDRTLAVQTGTQRSAIPTGLREL
jgi:hypothetical protein